MPLTAPSIVLALCCVGASGTLIGTSTTGWLNLEDWMYSFDYGKVPDPDYPFSEVASGPGFLQGRFFPSNEIVPEEVDAWQSEGALVDSSIRYLGEQKVIDAFKSHRDSWLSDSDLALSASLGLGAMRVNVGWFAFHSFPLPAEEMIVSDPMYPNKRYVSLSSAFLERTLDRFASAGVRLLIDLHNMPCGSSDATYNGIFPATCVFWTNSTCSAYGLQVVRNLLNWYQSLTDQRQATIAGFTLLNEPGHLLVGGGNGQLSDPSAIVSWLSAAVGVYKQMVVQPAQSKGRSVPLLFMNLIESAFPGPYNGSDTVLDVMASAMVDMGLANAEWAVYDVHHYYAWNQGNGVPAENCTTDERLRSYVRDTNDGSTGMSVFTANLQKAATRFGVRNVACSEWSLSFHHNESLLNCEAPNAVDVMYEEQVKGFAAANFSQFFWGWRMPQGGFHERYWSLKWHLTSQH